jgi:hypothetical protein
VGIEVEGAAEALHEAHRAGVAVADPERSAAPALPGEDGAEEDPEELA